MSSIYTKDNFKKLSLEAIKDTLGCTLTIEDISRSIDSGSDSLYKEYVKNLQTEQIKQLIESDPEFVFSARNNHSLEEIMANNPNGVTDRYASSLLCMTLEEFTEIYNNSINKYRQKFKIDVK